MFRPNVLSDDKEQSKCATKAAPTTDKEAREQYTDYDSLIDGILELLENAKINSEHNRSMLIKHVIYIAEIKDTLLYLDSARLLNQKTYTQLMRIPEKALRISMLIALMNSPEFNKQENFDLLIHYQEYLVDIHCSIGDRLLTHHYSWNQDDFNSMIQNIIKAEKFSFLMGSSTAGTQSPARFFFKNINLSDNKNLAKEIFDFLPKPTIKKTPTQ